MAIILGHGPTGLPVYGNPGDPLPPWAKPAEGKGAPMAVGGFLSGFLKAGAQMLPGLMQGAPTSSNLRAGAPTNAILGATGIPRGMTSPQSFGQSLVQNLLPAAQQFIASKKGAKAGGPVGSIQALAGMAAGRRVARGGGGGRFVSVGQRGKVGLVRTDGSTRVMRIPPIAHIGKNLPSHKQLVRLRRNLKRHREDALMILKLVSPGSLKQRRGGGRRSYGRRSKSRGR